MVLRLFNDFEFFARLAYKESTPTLARKFKLVENPRIFADAKNNLRHFCLWQK